MLMPKSDENGGQNSNGFDMPHFFPLSLFLSIGLRFFGAPPLWLLQKIRSDLCGGADLCT